MSVNPDSKVHGVNMGPTWVLSAPDGPHVGPMNLAVREISPILDIVTCSCTMVANSSSFSVVSVSDTVTVPATLADTVVIISNCKHYSDISAMASQIIENINLFRPTPKRKYRNSALVAIWGRNPPITTWDAFLIAMTKISKWSKTQYCNTWLPPFLKVHKHIRYRLSTFGNLSNL